MAVDSGLQFLRVRHDGFILEFVAVAALLSLAAGFMLGSIGVVVSLVLAAGLIRDSIAIAALLSIAETLALVTLVFPARQIAERTLCLPECVGKRCVFSCALLTPSRLSETVVARLTLSSDSTVRAAIVIDSIGVCSAGIFAIRLTSAVGGSDGVFAGGLRSAAATGS
jgi:hypothetical protein